MASPLWGLSVAIDGPMGSGKSTVARETARRLGFRYVDTGAMYRAVAVGALRAGIDPQDEDGLARLMDALQISIEPAAEGPARVLLDGEDVTPELRRIEVNRIVAKVARVPRVRETLAALQRTLGREGRVVMEGRDIGSVILPGAPVKVFLTASLPVRARRRQTELAASGTPMPLDDVERILEDDDRIATSRSVAPLRIAAGAEVIDSSDLTVEQVVDRIVSLAERVDGL